MESLYLKYRPQTFETMIGQRHIVTTLQNALANNRQVHAYLFSGPRGTGKTSTARIFAKALLCEKGVTPHPDGTCEQCTQIAAGTHPDVYELDAASRTGVANVREEIINRVAFAPTVGRYKVYIIDEVHMLSAQAFNALLKTLEEPPAHVVFILCTTDPQKVPETILSRCQRLEFHRIATEDIERHLAYVCEQEGFTAEPGALELIARYSRGGMRDALSTLEQLSVFGNGTLTLADTQSLLGEVSGDALAKMVDCIARRDVAGCFGLVADLADRGADIAQYARDLTSFIRNVYVASVTGPVEGVLDDGEDAQRMADLARRFGSPDRLVHILSVLGELETNLRTSLDQRLSLEVALTRMARPESDLSLEALAARLDALENKLSSAGYSAAPAPAASEAPAPAPAAKPAAQAAAPAPAAATPITATAPAEALAVPAAPVATTLAATPAAAPAAAPVEGHVRTPSAEQARPLGTDAARASEPQAPASAGIPQSQPVQSASTRAAMGNRESVASPAPAPAPASPVPAAAAQAASVASATPAASSQPAPEPIMQDEGTIQRLWNTLIDSVLKTDNLVGAVLRTARGKLTDSETLTIVNEGSSFAAKQLEKDETKKLIAKVASQVYGRTVQVKVVLPGPASGASVSPSRTESRAKRQPPEKPQAFAAPQPSAASQPPAAARQQPSNVAGATASVAAVRAASPQATAQPSAEPSSGSASVEPAPWESFSALEASSSASEAEGGVSQRAEASSAPAPATSPQVPSPVSASAPSAAPEPAPAPATSSASASALGAQQPKREKSRSSDKKGQAASSDTVDSSETDISAELKQILSEAFGDDVRVSEEK